MKLLLMVERGGKVVCASRDQFALRYYTKCSQRTRDLVLTPMRCRWWIVEAESAAEARRLIGCVDQDGEPLEARSNGRVLASGGKEEA